MVKHGTSASPRPPGKAGDVRFLSEVEKMMRELLETHPNFRDELISGGEPNQEASEGPKRQIEVDTMPKKKKDVKEPIFTWAFRSSKPRGGQTIIYETRLEDTGALRCNCPGWIFCPGPSNEKACKHTREISEDADDILTKFKNGEELPILEDVGEATTGASKTAAKATTKIKHGRLIEI